MLTSGRGIRRLLLSCGYTLACEVVQQQKSQLLLFRCLALVWIQLCLQPSQPYSTGVWPWIFAYCDEPVLVP